jgi:hypothetical protein
LTICRHFQSYSSWTATSSLKQAHSSVPQTWEATPQTLDNVQTTTLDSGLKVTTVSSELPLAAVGLHVKAGARFETGESRGAAHFLRHLAFSVCQLPQIAAIFHLSSGSDDGMECCVLY